MNKIYRTVYNETTGTWVAVCETAKTHTKSSGKSSVVKAAVAAGLVAVTGVAGAVPVTAGTGIVCDNEDSIVCIGNGAVAKAGGLSAGEKKGVTVIGADAKVSGKAVNNKRSKGGETVVGSEAQADGNGAVSIGGKGGLPFNGDPSTGTITYGKGTVAVGRNARAMATVLERDSATGKIDFSKLLNPNGNSVAQGTNALGKSIVVSDKHNDAGKTRISNDINQGQNIAVGDNAQAFSHQSIAVGGNTMALGVASIAIGGDDVGNGTGKTFDANGKVQGENDAGFAQSLNTIKAIQQGLTNIGKEFQDQAKASNVTLTHSDYVPESVTNILGAAPYKDTTMASGDIAMALGAKAQATGNLSDAIGMNAVASGESSLAVGTVARAEGQYANAVGTGATAKGTRTNAFGTGATAVGNYANAVGTSQAEGAYSSAMGYLNESLGANSVAVGTKNLSKEGNTVAMGVDNEALGQESIAIGTGNKSTGYQSLAYGQSNTTSNTQSITFGTGNTVTSMNSGSFGSGNTVDSGNASNGSYVIGNSNNVTTANTFVLGSSVGNANLGGDATLANSVYLGAGSTTATTKGSAGLTNGKPTSINTATVQDITYSGFAGKNAQGIVSVGTDSSARRIQNVAAGAITATSTDAINGSQLYAVLPKYETDPNTKNVTSVKVGNQTYNFAQGGAADGNDITELTVNDYQAAGNTTGNLKLTDQGSGDSHNYNVALNNTVELGDNTADGSLTVGNQAGDSKTEIKPNNINFTNADGGSITNVASHLKDQAATDTAMNADNAPANFGNMKNEAATVGDVLNAGWNLKVGGQNADFVQHGDTVAFGNSDTVSAAYDGGVIKFNANTTPLTVTNGVVNAPANNNALVTAGDVQKAINNSGWFVNTGVATGGTNSGASKELVAAGEEVKFIAGNGIGIAQKGQELTISNTIQFLQDDGSAAPNDGTAKKVKLGNNTYNLGGSTTVITSNGEVEVKGKDSVKVDTTTAPNATNPAKTDVTYTVSIPVVANSGGSSANAATIGSDTEGSVAVGENASIGNNVQNSIAIGKDASVNNNGTGNVVIGSGSSTPNRAKNMVVIGTDLKITQNTPNAVVIGSGSAASSAADSDLNPNKFNFRSSSLNTANEGGVNDGANADVATFNVGAEQGQLRQIKGVAAGRTEKGSTDAVNGDQLYTVALAVDNMGYSLAGGGKVNSSDGSITGGTGVLGESFTVNTDDAYGKIGTIIGKNIAGTGADNIEDAIKQSRTEVQKEDGSPITVTGNTTNGKTTYTVGVETQALTINSDGSVDDVPDNSTTGGTLNQNKLVTAGDVVNVVNNTFWVASDGTKDETTGAENTTQVKASNKVTIKGDKGVKVALDSDNKTFTVSGLTVSASTPATGTSGNATATELTDADGKKYNIGGADGDTVTDLTVNGGNPAGNTTGNLKLTKNESNPDNPIYDVSLNNVVTVGDTASTSNDKPVTIDGSKGTINFTKNDGSVTGLSQHFTKTGDTTAPSETADTTSGKADNQAATVGDVKNVGWNLKVGGQAKDFINHGDTVNFGNGKGTTAQFAKDAKTGETTISFDIAKAGDSKVDTTVTNADAGKVTGGTGDEYWDSNQVQNAINNAGWKAGVGAKANAKDELINAGDRVGLVAGQGVKVTQDGSNFTFATDYVFKDGKGDDITNKGGDVATITSKDDKGNDVTYNFGDGNDNTVTAVTVNGGQNATDNAADGGNLKLTETKDANGNPTYDVALNNTVELGDNTTDGSLTVGNKAGDSKTEIAPNNINFTNQNGGSITNVASHLKDPASKDDKGQVINPANTPDKFDSVKNEAATVGDVLNAGWNLKVGGQDADFVQHGDTVAFGNGKGTTAQYDATNGVVSFDITKAKNPTVPTTGNNAGKVTGGTGDQYWDSTQVQTAINNAGWFVNSGAVKGKGTNSGAAKTLVKAGDEVKFIAGDGMNIVQDGTNFTFNAKIVDTNGKQLPVDDNGNYVVSIVNNGNPVGIDDKGNFNTGGSGSGSGKPFTITGNDADGNTSTTTIDGVDNTPGSGVTFVGDENVKVIKQPTQGGDGTDVAVGLQNVVNVGGTQNGANSGTPNAGAVTIDGTKGGNSIAISTDGKGNLKVGNSNKNNAAPIKITNVKAGDNGTQDAVNVAQVEDVVGAANKDANGVVKTTGSKGEEYTLKTYNVNGRTEYLTNNVVEAVSKMNEQGIKFFHVNDGTQTPVEQASNKVDSQAFGKNSIAIGVKSTAKGNNSIVIGTENTVNGNNSGAIGDPSVVNGDNSYSVGNNNTVATNNTFVLGNEVTKTAENSVFLGNFAGTDVAGAGATGTVSDAKVNNLTYSGFAGETANGLVSVGGTDDKGQVVVRRVSGVAAGEISATSTDAINGSQLYSALSNSGVYVTGNGAAPDDTNLVKLGDKKGALNFVDGNGTTAVVKGNTVTFNTVPGYNAGIEAGNNVELETKPVLDQDGNQLYIDNAGNSTTEATDSTGAPNKRQETTVIHAKQPDLRPIEQHVQQVENNAYAGVAQAMATAGLPQAYLPGKSMVAIAGGQYKGEQGYALGLSSISDSGNWVFKATASGNSRNNFGGTIGAGYQW